MKIKFIKDFKYPEVDISVGAVRNSEGYYLKDEVEEWFQWLIDNGFAEEVKESSWEKSTRGDNYYFINGAGVITSTVWMENSQDRVRYLMGNCFRTTEAAERYRDYLKAIATVRQDEGVMTPREIDSADSCGRTVWCITYTLDSGFFVYTCRLAMLLPQIGAIYFNSRGHANASLGKHPDEWKIIANYDWSRE